MLYSVFGSRSGVCCYSSLFSSQHTFGSPLGGRESRNSNLLWAIAASFFCAHLVGVELVALWLIAKTSSPFVAGSFLAIGLLPFVFSHLLTTPTQAGRRVLDHMEGFRLFLNEVDRHRFNRLVLPVSVDLTNAALGMPSSLSSDPASQTTHADQS